jgi:hypothetical protein
MDVLSRYPNHPGVRTSLLLAGGCTLAPPQLTAPPPPYLGRRRQQQGLHPAIKTIISTTRVHSLPPSSVPPPLLGSTADGQVRCWSAPSPHASPRLPHNWGRRPGAQDRGYLYSLSTWQLPPSQTCSLLGQHCPRRHACHHHSSCLETRLSCLI